MRKVIIVIAELLALTVFVIAAFYAPQIIFRVQDSLICSKTELSEREKVNAETLSTTYEKSLYQRMLNFADGIAADDNFYVTSQELEINQEIYDLLYSDSILYNSFMQNFLLAGLISEPYFYDQTCTVNQWTQYVIYSDNYEKGVNFILWYIEIQNEGYEIMKLLVDAETSTLYAIKTEKDNEMFLNYGYSHIDIVNYNNLQYLFRDVDTLPRLWLGFALHFDVQQAKSILSTYMEDLDEYSYIWGLSPYYTDSAVMSVDETAYMVDEQMNKENTHMNIEDKYRKEGGCLTFQLPYGDNSLEVLLNIGDIDWNTMKKMLDSPDITFGVRQIYEMIPEFA